MSRFLGAVFFAFVCFLTSDFAQAEPWLANRYAQNCASCHAPGRLNREPSKRRCTLSCQGCHVNPNGGGLRNAYGRWNSERWVRSFYTDLAWNQKSPAPLAKQHYMKKDLNPKLKAKFAKRGAPLVGFPGVVKNEKLYFESSNYQAAKDQIDELARMTRDDPYRIERSSPVQVGGDLRLFWIQQGEGAASEALEKGTFYPMVFDFGVRVRPVRQKLSFVYEGRAFNSKTSDPGSFDALFAGGAFTRSAYVLVDDLWYNSYFQYGFYRPMFGIYNPNHNAMIAGYTGLNQNTRLKMVGVGAAPNVPFGIVNMVMPTEGASPQSMEGESGYNLTLGMRFVRFGAHLVGTLWSTASQDGTNERQRDMWNVNAGGVLGRFVLNGEMTSIKRVVADQLDQILVYGIDAKYRFWREMYLMTGFTMANAGLAINNTGSLTRLVPGSGQEFSFGVRSMLLSGLQMEALWTDKTNKETGFATTKENTMQLQLHAYF